MNPNAFTYKTAYQSQVRENIRAEINLINARNNLTLSVVSLDGEVNQDFLLFCSFNNLRFSVVTAPFVDHNGISCNEAIFFNDGSDVHSVPLDGEGNPTTLVADVMGELDLILTEIEKPIKKAPLDINTVGIIGDVARRKLAGEPLRKILTELMQARIGYPDPVLPPFKIIKVK